ncbi:hypothetical protein JZ751_029217, partial [Albula glossodonta]
MKEPKQAAEEGGLSGGALAIGSGYLSPRFCPCWPPAVVPPVPGDQMTGRRAVSPPVLMPLRHREKSGLHTPAECSSTEPTESEREKDKRGTGIGKVAVSVVCNVSVESRTQDGGDSTARPDLSIQPESDRLKPGVLQQRAGELQLPCAVDWKHPQSAQRMETLQPVGEQRRLEPKQTAYGTLLCMT